MDNQTQQQHLENAFQQQKQLIGEINDLNTQIISKREQALKLQGVMDYLNELGVTFPKPLETPQEVVIDNQTET